MGKSKSWFDLNHDSITCGDLIWLLKIWFESTWFDLDLIRISHDLIWFYLWFEQITSFCVLSYIIVKWIIVSLWIFYQSMKPASSATVERLFSTCGSITRSRLSISTCMITCVDACYFTCFLVFIARQHTDARYWYSNSVRSSVCPWHAGILWKRLNISS